MTVADERIRLDSNEYTEYSIAQYRYCEYEIIADALDIEVDGRRARKHTGSTKRSTIVVSNGYSMFAPKSVHIFIQCQP